MNAGGTLAITRGVRIAGGLGVHALLAWHFGPQGYGLLALATSALGLLRLLDLAPSAALATFVPLLLGEQRPAAAGRVVRFAWACNAATALLTSLLLVLLAEPIGATFGSPELAAALPALALWNLAPLLRGPLDPELLHGLRAWNTLLGWRIVEHGGGIAAALAALLLGADPAGYFLLATCAQLPLAWFAWRAMPLLAGLRGRDGAPVLRRFVRFCLPVATSQLLFKLYANLGAPWIAASVSVGMAGAYRLALTVADLIAELLAAIPQARGPELAAARARGDAAPVWRETAAATLASGLPVLLLLVAAAPALTWLLGAAGFAAAVPLLLLFAPQILLRTASHPAALLLLAYERPRRVTRANAVKLALELMLALLLVPRLGAAGVVAAHALAVGASTWLLAADVRALLGSGALPGLAPALLLLLGAIELAGAAPPFGAAGILLLLALWSARLAPRAADDTVTLVANSRSVGGVELHLLQLARALIARGLSCDVIVPAAPATADWRASLRAAGVVERRLAGVAAPWDLPGFVRLARALWGRSGILHFHLNSMDDQAPGLLLARLVARGPLVATLQLGRGDRPARWSIKGIRRRIALRLPDRLICVASALCRDVAAQYGVAPARLRTVRNGVDVGRFRPDPARRERIRRGLGVPDEQPLLLFAGRMTEVKGIATLLDALARLPAPPLTLFVGDGPERARVERAAAALPLRCVGWRDDVECWLSAADGLVLPSRHEGLPYAVLEGMASGLPIVATAVAGTPEVVDAATGFLVPPDDPAALADAIAAWVKLGTAGRRRLGEAGRARMQVGCEAGRAHDAIVAVYAELAPVPAAAAPIATDAAIPVHV
jgi:glycosyltransferase involved in cell wall biosynthesis/O-antigen/teichoic acid export membrane protein